MWLYEQITGSLKDCDGELIGKGYSGHGDGVNNPSMEQAHDVGPIPRGLYSITPPHDSAHGPFTLGLLAHSDNEMFGRSGFLMHGDRVDAPGQKLASLGCIIMSRDVREKVWASGDHVLKVVSMGV